MSLNVAMRQLHRLANFHSTAAVLPGGRVLTREEGKVLARKVQAATDDAEENNDMIADAAAAEAAATVTGGGSVMIERSIASKVATMKKSHDKQNNVSMAVRAIRRDRLPTAILREELPKARRAAEKLEKRPVIDPKAAKAARKERIFGKSKK